MPINDGKYVVPAWQDGGPPAIDAAELTAIGQSIVTNQNSVAQNTQNVSTLQQQMSTANQNITSLQQFQTTATSQISNLTNNYLPKSGGTMTGPLTLAGNPNGNLQAAPKQYVDARGWTLTSSASLQFSQHLGTVYWSNYISMNLLPSHKEIMVQVDATNFKVTAADGPEYQQRLRFDMLLYNGGLSGINSGYTGTMLIADQSETYQGTYTFMSMNQFYLAGLYSIFVNGQVTSYPVFLGNGNNFPLSTQVNSNTILTRETQLGIQLSGVPTTQGAVTISGDVKLSVYGR